MQQLKTEDNGGFKNAGTDLSRFAGNLNNIRLLKGFTQNDSYEFFGHGYVQDYNRDDIVVNGRQSDSDLYIIIDGRLSVWKMNTKVICLNSGESFNETLLFCPNPDSIVARAEEPVRVLKISRDRLLDYFSMKPERLFKVFTLNIINILQQKLVYYESRIAQFSHQV